MSGTRHFYGKYQGTVTDNADPQRRGRVRVEVRAVQGRNETTWAEACLPLSGAALSSMGVFCVPPKGAPVWVEFEAGDPERPIWSGCRFSDQAEVPKAALAPGAAPDSRLVLQTGGQSSIVLSDVASEGIRLRSSSGAQITIDATGITISTSGGAKIELKGNQVNINGQALEII